MAWYDMPKSFDDLAAKAHEAAQAVGLEAKKEEPISVPVKEQPVLVAPPVQTSVKPPDAGEVSGLPSAKTVNAPPPAAKKSDLVPDAMVDHMRRQVVMLGGLRGEKIEKAYTRFEKNPTQENLALLKSAMRGADKAEKPADVDAAIKTGGVARQAISGLPQEFGIELRRIEDLPAAQQAPAFQKLTADAQGYRAYTGAQAAFTRANTARADANSAYAADPNPTTLQNKAAADENCDKAKAAIKPAAIEWAGPGKSSVVIGIFGDAQSIALR